MPKVILDWDQRYERMVIISDFLENIRAKFSVVNDSKRMLTRMGKPVWHLNDFISPITSNGRVDIGLYFEIVNLLRKDLTLEYEIITTDTLKEQLLQSYTWNNNYEITQLSLPLRPYQESGIKRCISMGYGTIVIGTAGGKTLLMASLIQTIRANQKPFTTIVILPSNLLVQTYKEFLSFGISDKDISMWGGDNEFNKSPIIIASAEILKSNLIVFSERKPIPKYKEWKPKDSGGTYADYLKAHAEKERARKTVWKKKRKSILDQLNDIELVLMDEVHGLRRNNVINDVLSLFSTRHRFGFTGTMPPELLDQWNIIGNIGPIILDVDSAALRSMDYISQVKAQIIKLHYKNPPRFKLNEDDQSSAYNEECEFLYHNQFRNKVIAHLANKFNNNSLILVDKIEHGETLEKILKEQTKKTIFFIRGSVEMDEREKLRALMEKNDNIVCIAMSRIFAVGVNIKNLHYVLFAQGGKAKVTLIQSIGRGLRKHESKECLVLIDLADATHYGERHLAERIKYYGEEQINYEQKELFE